MPTPINRIRLGIQDMPPVTVAGNPYPTNQPPVALCEVEIDAGHTGLKGFSLRATRTNNGVSSSSTALYYKDATNPFPTTAFTGSNKLLMLTRPYTHVAGGTTSARVRMEVDLVESTAISATIRWGNVRLFKVI